MRKMVEKNPKARQRRRAATYNQSEFSATQKPFSLERMAEVFRLSDEHHDRLISRENSTLEFKEGFGWKSVSEYARTMAAFANTRGGYLVFGIGNRPRTIKGLMNDLFDEIDPQRLTEGLNALFSPEIRWEQYIHTLQGKKIGLIYVFPSVVKPVIAVKTEGEVREAEVYYRYSGRTEKIKYPELRQLLEDQRRRDTDVWLKHLSHIAKAGIENAAILDTHHGTVTGPSGRSFIIDETLLNKLKFIREGEFRETEGSPTLKLVGNLEAVPEGFIQPTRNVPMPIRTPEIVYGFLIQSKVSNPEKYIEQICFESSGFLPVYYYIHLAGFSLTQAIKIIEVTQSTIQSKTKLLQRLRAQEKFLAQIPNTENIIGKKKWALLQQIREKSLDGNVLSSDIIHILQTIRCLEPNQIEISYLGPILKSWFEKYYTDRTITNIGDCFRRAICHLDYALFRESIPSN